MLNLQCFLLLFDDCNFSRENQRIMRNLLPASSLSSITSTASVISLYFIDSVVCYCFSFHLVAARVLEHPHTLHGSNLKLCRFIPTEARQVFVLVIPGVLKTGLAKKSTHSTTW